MIFTKNKCVYNYDAHCISDFKRIDNQSLSLCAQNIKKYIFLDLQKFNRYLRESKHENVTFNDLFLFSRVMERSFYRFLNESFENFSRDQKGL